MRLAAPLCGHFRGLRLESETFRCVRCKRQIESLSFGTQHRNHCPYCLWSRHLDNHPGDRKSGCQSAMEPIAIALREGGEWVLIHRCVGCSVLHENRIAGDDSMLLLMSLAAGPLAQPPIPLDLRSS